MTLVAGLRAASYGIPFQPVAGVHGSELAHINHWQTLRDPYGSGKDVYGHFYKFPHTPRERC